MKSFSKFSNIFLFGIALVLFFIIQPNNKISLELSSMLTGEDKKFYQISEQFSYVKTFFVTVKGFGKEDLHKLNEIKKKLVLNPKITLNDQLNNKALQQFRDKYLMYLNDLKYKYHTQIDTKKQLTKIYQDMLSSPFYFNIDKNDPLSIVQQENLLKNIKFKNGNLILDNYGYLAIFSIEAKTDERSRIKIYNEIHNVLDKYKNIKFFSFIFYYVENSKEIQSDVKVIITTSMILLGILYLLILRNLYLFFNIALTLITSVIVGELVVTSIFEQTSIIALVFSTAVTSVSIDYMFHHYLHNYYNQKFQFNSSVFYGFLTTVTAFILISFINFPLIKQISIFTIVSLIVAYIHFAFIYPYLNIKHKEPYSKENYTAPFTIKSSYILIFSIVVIVVSLFYTKFDFNIKNLDYQNKKLIKIEKFFKDKLSKEKQLPILITGTTYDELISHSKFIKKLDPTSVVPLSYLLSQEEYIKKLNQINKFDFEQLKQKINTLSTQIGFKNGYFKNSYNETLLYPSYPVYTQELIQSFGFDIAKSNNKYITFAMVSPSKLDEILKLPFTKSAQSKVLFENSLKKVYNELMLFGGLTLLLIISILAMVTKKSFLSAFTYILFPAALILCYSWFIPLNIMHIFMAFVVLAIGIDYGIYMNEANLSHNTTLAIIFSLISTFAGFGVLILSDINSLFSIGITAVIGVLGILFLLIFQDRNHIISRV